MALLIARILIWNVYESKTSLDELPDLGEVRHLLGTDPDVAEEFDVE